LKDGKKNSASQPQLQTLQIEPRDLDVILSAGAVIQGKLKDLMAIRESFKNDARFHVIY
jgi:hypothetical protein